MSTSKLKTQKQNFTWPQNSGISESDSWYTYEGYYKWLLEAFREFKREYPGKNLLEIELNKHAHDPGYIGTKRYYFDRYFRLEIARMKQIIDHSQVLQAIMEGNYLTTNFKMKNHGGANNGAAAV